MTSVFPKQNKFTKWSEQLTAVQLSAVAAKDKLTEAMSSIQSSEDPNSQCFVSWKYLLVINGLLLFVNSYLASFFILKFESVLRYMFCVLSFRNKTDYSSVVVLTHCFSRKGNRILWEWREAVKSRGTSCPSWTFCCTCSWSSCGSTFLTL